MAIFSAANPSLLGHSMAVVGWMTFANKNNAAQGMNVLTVFDGWNSIRMLNFNLSDYTFCDATIITR